MLVSFGAVGGIVTVATGRPVGPLSISAVTTTVPETVPVSSKTGVANTAVVLSAAIVKGTVLEPVENRTAGSSAGTTLFDTNEIFSEPVTGFSGVADNDNPTGIC